jgi:hypothetical protein
MATAAVNGTAAANCVAATHAAAAGGEAATLQLLHEFLQVCACAVCGGPKTGGGRA